MKHLSFYLSLLLSANLLWLPRVISEHLSDQVDDASILGLLLNTLVLAVLSCILAVKAGKRRLRWMHTAIWGVWTTFLCLFVPTTLPFIGPDIKGSLNIALPTVIALAVLFAVSWLLSHHLAGWEEKRAEHKAKS